MANLNLSQFTEKLFVADADHTFIWDTAASISKRVSRNSWLNSGTLTSDAPVTISQTWSTTGTYTAAKVNVTETATANSLSNLLDLQLGSVSRLKVNKEGNLVIAAVSGAMIQCTASSQGVLSSASAFPKIWGARFDFQTAAGGTTMLGIGPTQVEIPTQLVFNTNTILLRDGADNTLALRNGGNPQTFNVYGTYTSGTSYERLTLSAPSAANAIIGTNKGSGGGTARGLEFQTDGVTRMTLSASSHIIQVNSACELLTASGTGAKFDFSFNGLQCSNISGLGVSWANNANASSSKHVGLFAYSTELGVVQVNNSTKDTFRDLRCRSVIQQLPITTTITPATNGDFVVEATSNTTLTFKLKGTDGTVRSGTITLSV